MGSKALRTHSRACYGLGGLLISRISLLVSGREDDVSLGSDGELTPLGIEDLLRGFGTGTWISG